MFTVLWKTDGMEELFSTPGVTKIKANPDNPDCGGRDHIAFQAFTAVEGDPDKLTLTRTLIDTGEVYVMNADGKTVAFYRFKWDRCHNIPKELAKA